MFDFLRRALSETKESAVGPSIYSLTMGRAAWTPRQYDKLANEAYVRNAIGYACIRRIAEAAADVPIKVFEGDTELENHPVIDLLKRPNPFQGGDDFWLEFHTFLQTSGQGYIEGVTLDSQVRELYALRPDRLRVIPGPRGWPVAYVYKVGLKEYRFDVPDGPDQQWPILHFKMCHPIDDHYGLSPIEPAAYSIDVHNEAGQFNKALLQNSARPSGLLSTTGDMNPEKARQLSEQLDRNFVGAKNSGRPLIAGNDLKWTEFGISPRDLEFIEGKREVAREVCIAFGFPPMLLGIPGDNTYANYQEANVALYRNTVLPIVRRALMAFSNWLQPTYPGLDIKPDLDGIEALNYERQALWERVQSADFLTVNEQREMVGKDPIDGGDVILVSGAEIPLQDAGMSMQPGGGEPDDDADE